MPPRTRTRASKALKENIDTGNKLKSVKNNTKALRKALADKTNSASDETSVELPKISTKRVNTRSNVENFEEKLDGRLRRNKRAPQRFDRSIATAICKATVYTPQPPDKTPNSSSQRKSPIKNCELNMSPFKTPSKIETTLAMRRPRRICRLPSRFDDHFVSPSKVVTSSPYANVKATQEQVTDTINSRRSQNGNNSLDNSSHDAMRAPEEQVTKPITRRLQIAKKCTGGSPNASAKVPQLQVSKTIRQRLQNAKKLDKSPNENKKTPHLQVSSTTSSRTKLQNPKKLLDSSPDGKKKLPQMLGSKTISNRPQNATKMSEYSTNTKVPKTVSPRLQNAKKIFNKSLSFQVLGEKKKRQSDKKDLDVYEFTFDPTEEPLQRKKNRKKPVTKKQKALKTVTRVTYKSTYERNMKLGLAALKNSLKASKQVEAKSNNLPQIQEVRDNAVEQFVDKHIVTNKCDTIKDSSKTSAFKGNYPSIRIEDIAADIEPSVEHHDDLNYSPVNSPRPQSPVCKSSLEPQQNPKRVRNDPLNLQEDLSFFDDVPVASSSMNMSVRHPLASPWRVEFGCLPIKWHSNAYVKPNMTPAVESSFICSEESNKKHVYTNMVPETHESLPEIVSSTPVLKQTSIISFIKEVAERKAKKKLTRCVSPSKTAVESDNIDIETLANAKNATNEIPVKTVADNPASSDEISGSNIDTSNDADNSNENIKTRKRKNDGVICDRQAKSPHKHKDDDFSYFGFNESEDQENVIPPNIKANPRGRYLRTRTRAVLQEYNGPSRLDLPIAAKSKKIIASSDVINKVYEELKSAADAPEFPAVDVPVFPDNAQNKVTYLEDIPSSDDGQSVHLFEDIDVVHHLKPTRKSYGKAKKVTFPQQSDSESVEATTSQDDQSYFEDDLGDLTFEVPNVKEKKKAKKKRPKKLMSKKEEKEAEEWAAGFNSMCEEIEDFPLLVE